MTEQDKSVDVGEDLFGQLVVVGKLEGHVGWQEVDVMLLNKAHEGVVKNTVADAGKVDAVGEDL